ncbi:MAG: TonB-dependent receptor plug domain-containing protein [Woeseiaceae bacterium]|nr:TonB-dependent receptor plug domain-containing protein [Woeseiaceae bacterium]
MLALKRFLRVAVGWQLVLACGLTLSPVYAQESEEETEAVEEITVTGSRIARDTFSTTTPIQVLSTEEAQRIGISSISELMQKATVSSGTQIDGSLNNNAGQTNASEAPPEGGVGSACINLRGLGCERTLVLVNGKRLGLAGIRGAPPQPDINMLPIGMVEGVDVLTGGLSTIYGADAVAGVVNVRLKQDFEGINFTVTSELPEEEGGEIYAASLIGGVGNDLGNFTFGMEYSRQERVATGDRDFSSCLRRGNWNYTESGQVVGGCRSDFPDNWVVTDGDIFTDAGYTQVGGDGPIPHPLDAVRLIYTPGTSNILDPLGNPVTGFSTFASLPDNTTNSLRGFPNALRPFYLDRFRYVDGLTNDQFDRRVADLWRPYERFSLVVNGHVDPGWDNNEEVYFEGYYFNRQNEIIAATEQIFPTVLGMAPLVDSENVPILDANGAVQLVDNPLNPFPFDVSPIITLDDVPQTFDTELQQVRLVTGLKGDLPFSDNWGYDVSASYDRATGFVVQPILLENHLFNATQTIGVVADALGNPTSEVICGARVVSDLNGQFTLLPCVPADFMNASIAGDSVTTSGRFATQAERDYLVANRTNRTVTELTSLQAYVTGSLFDMPGGGPVGTAFGIEYREDTIASQNSAAGVLGLNAAENPLQEGETNGSRTTFDAYAEVSAPIVIDAGWADLFQVDLALRFTDDENFGSETVYKAGFLWNFNEYLGFSSSFNTSFRAPNLREQFLADQAGALAGSADPCRQPAIDLIPPGPDKDRLVNNCILSGADVTVLGSTFTVAIPTSVGGAAGLNPETSESLTATLTLSQPWTDRFDFDVAVTYFDIKIEDTVRALDPDTIVARCFNDQENLASPFCARVERDRPSSPPELNFISFVRAGFVNTGEETVQGFDLTTRLNADLGPTTINWVTGSTFLQERLTQEFPPSDADPNGSAIVDNVGRIGTPEWTFQSTLGVSLQSWDFTWQARWFDDMEFPEGVPNPLITDVNGLINGVDPDTIYEEWTNFGFFNSSQVDTDTLGPIRPVADAEGQWQHDVSVTYNSDRFAVTAGVNNVLNEEPPLIDQGSGPNRNNAVTSSRYDLIGRSFFIRADVSF